MVQVGGGVTGTVGGLAPTLDSTAHGLHHAPACIEASDRQLRLRFHQGCRAVPAYVTSCFSEAMRKSMNLLKPEGGWRAPYIDSRIRGMHFENRLANK